MSGAPETSGGGDAAQRAADGDEDLFERALELLAACTEAGRLERARKLVAKVDFVVNDGELAIAAVANYNVVVDLEARRIQHGCRDFQGQAAARRLCKHVAATLLALAPERAVAVARELAEGIEAPAAGIVTPWRLEVITRFGPPR